MIILRIATAELRLYPPACGGRASWFDGRALCALLTMRAWGGALALVVIPGERSEPGSHSSGVGVEEWVPATVGFWAARFRDDRRWVGAIRPALPGGPSSFETALCASSG
jgi:hypothetical protein